MFQSAYPRSRGPVFADLPPTLQPCAIAASAPSSDHLRVAALSGLVYCGLVAAGVAASRFAPPPALAPVRPAETGPTIVYVPPNGIRLTLPQPPAARRGSGGSESATPVQAAPPVEVPTEAPAGLPTANHALDPMAAGAGTSNAGTSPGVTQAGTTAGTMVHDFTAVGLAVLRQVDPSYPEFARRARIQGPVVLMVTVDEAGQPVQVQVLDGHPVFHEAAVQAARQWRFAPAQINGRPVMAAFRLTLKFTLR